MPVNPPFARRGCIIPVLLAWLGIVLGLVSFGSAVVAAPVPLAGQPVFAMAALPTPSDITAYTAAVCGAVITALNTALLVWHKLSEPKRRRKRKTKADETNS